jgi:hypothetical protein
MVDFSFGGVLPCNECAELHQVFLAAQEDARLPRRADQPDASIGLRVKYHAGHGPGFIHPLIPKINEVGTWCEECEDWTSYGRNALLGKLFRCWRCGNNSPAEHRIGDVFNRAGALPQRFAARQDGDERETGRSRRRDGCGGQPPTLKVVKQGVVPTSRDVWPCLKACAPLAG